MHWYSITIDYNYYLACYVWFIENRRFYVSSLIYSIFSFFFKFLRKMIWWLSKVQKLSPNAITDGTNYNGRFCNVIFLTVRLRFKNWDVFQFVDTRVNGVSILKKVQISWSKEMSWKEWFAHDTSKKCVFYMYVNVEVSQKLHVCYMYTFLRNWRW